MFHAEFQDKFPDQGPFNSVGEDFYRIILFTNDLDLL